MEETRILQIAEIPYDSGSIRFRYARKLAPNEKRWVRHGLFEAFYETGAVASIGEYVEGLEEGIWRDYHPTGMLAAEGVYSKGKKIGKWRYWNDSGAEERGESFP